MKNYYITFILFATILTNAQTTIFSENFNASNSFTLNTGGSGGNTWIVNNQYIDGFGIFGDTPDQISPITGFPNSNYLHIYNASVCGFGACNALFDTGSASNRTSTMTNNIATTGYSAVSFSFWYLCEGATGVSSGAVEYSTDGGTIWTVKQSNINGVSSWTQLILTDVAFNNQAQLKFRFRWVNGSSGADPAFSVDDVLVAGTSAPAICPPALAVLPVGNYAIPSCFPTIQAAANHINTYGTSGTGTVQFDVATGHTETAPVGGIEIRATALGTATRPIVFKKIGAGANPTITAFTPQASSIITDAVIKIIGGNYITIDGLTLLENPANTTTTTGSNNMTEYGVALFYSGTASTANGAQNNTLKNCTIDLTRTYTNTFGIFSNSNVTATAANTSAQASNLAGSNSNLTITGNTITDVNQGIVVVGSGSSSTTHNDGLVIGGSLADANTITNFGTSSTSGFFGVTGTINGIVIRNTKNFNVSFNTITSSNTPNISSVRGVFVDSFNQAPTGTLAHTISNNIISLSNGSSGAGIEGISNNSTTGNATTTININSNDFNSFTANTSTTFIKNNQSGIAININDNTFTNLTINNTSFVNYFIDMGATSLTATGVENVNGNKIIGTFTKNGASGGLGIYNGTGSSVTGSIVNNNNNEFSNITLAGITFTEGWRNANGSSISGPTKTIENNKFENWSGGTGVKTVMFITGYSGTSSVSNNTINNINTVITGTNAITPINIGNTGVATTLNIKNNIITNINGGTGAIIGIKCDSKSTNVNIETNQIKNFLSAGTISAIESINASPTLITISTNDIDNLKSSTASDINGIKNSANVLPKIETNSIKNLECTNASNTGYIRGINLTNAFATTLPPIINNNVIDGLVSATNQTASSIAGIHVAASANHNITNNTVKNIATNTSNSGTAGSTAVVGIWSSSSGTAQKINNNTVFNISANNAGSVSTSVAGIMTSASSTAGSEVFSNTIYGLKNRSGASAPIISGYLNAGGGVWTVANNMISLDNGTFTNGIQIFGINDIGNNGSRNYYFNSINIGGSSTSTVHKCVAFQFNKIGAALIYSINIKNNIFNVQRTGSGKNYAAGNPTGTNFNGIFYSFNVYNILDPATLGLSNGPVDNDFTNWQLYAGDTNSFTQVPITFTDVSIADLHLNNANCDSGNTGTPLSITTDFDNQTRDTTLPTIGADETTRTNTNWNGTTWNNGTPTLTKFATISGNYDMTLGASRPSIDACSLIINSGTISVSANKYINIQNDLTINNGAILNILDKGSLVMIEPTGKVTNNGSGIANVTRTTPNMQLYDYTYWSSPMVADNLGTRFANWNTNSIYNFSTQNYSDLFSGAGYPQTAGTPDSFDDNGNDWTKVTTPASTTMAPTVGYAIMAATSGSFPRTETVTFSGKLNTGDRTFPLKLSANNASNIDDYNLVGNPYPSSIFADDFINDNLPNISGTIYFWTHIGNLEPALTNPGPNTSNYNSNDYALYNLSGPTGTGSPSGSGSTTPDGYIGVGQGFFVESETNSNDLIFSNSMRSSGYSNSQFFRNANSTTQKDRLWLNFKNVDQMFSQQLIAYFPQTTLGYDLGYDGLGNKTQNYVNFYSFMNNDTSLAYKIQSRNTFNQNDQVQLGFSSAVSGQTSISIDRFEGVFENQNIYLQDNLLNITHDLKQADYIFTTNYGSFNDRFVLKYINTSLSNDTFVNEQNAVHIYAKDAKIAITSISDKIQSIQIFDILGRNIYENKVINAKTFTVDNLAIANQTLIVKTKLENGTIVSKKIVL